MLTRAAVKKFRNTIYTYYHLHTRRLPWRQTRNPYCILVSEIMLQQTQVNRVLEKYTQFLKRFPTLTSLAEAKLGDVYAVWQGLGYNRRAKFLRDLAWVLVSEYKGRLPKTQAELLTLPGIGPATAAALQAFVFNQPALYLETNVRSVYLHHFFKDKVSVPDSALLPVIEQTMDKSNPRKWNYALLDYGVYIKQTFKNPSRRSLHHIKQSKFVGSLRQVRGGVLKQLVQAPASAKELSGLLRFEVERVEAALHALQAEKMIIKKGRRYFLAL